MSNTFEYLIQYGRLGFVGRFKSALTLDRGDKVIIRGPRGTECGEVLIPTDSRFVRMTAFDQGEILDVVTPKDLTRIDEFASKGQELLQIAAMRGGKLGLPMVFVDAEVTLDRTAILHILPWSECDATSLLDELSAETGLTVRLLDLSHKSPEESPTSKGCGKPGCGSESGGCSSCGTGGGCSTGSCSRGSVKSSEELTTYFSDLRKKMEDSGMVRTPLN